jgi:hypothetical protein
MKTKVTIRLIVLTTIMTGPFPLHFETVARADLIGISSTSSVNPTVGPFTQSSDLPNTSVSTIAMGLGGTASASASTLGIVGSQSSAENQQGLSNGASSGASFLSGFTILGNPNNVSLPLTFNFGLSGSLLAATNPEDSNSIAVATLQYDIQSSSTRILGGAQLVSQGGLIVSQFSSALPTNGIVANISPTIMIGGKLVDLTNAALGALGFPPIGNVPLPNVQTVASAAFAAEIALAIFNQGLAALDLPAGLTLKVGFDVAYTFQSTLSVPVDVMSNVSDALSFSLSTAATANQGAHAVSMYGNTLSLESITLPTTFTSVNPSDLEVAFDSGFSMPVTSQVSTPAPDSFFLFAAGLMCIVPLRHAGQRYVSSRQDAMNKRHKK